MQTGWPAPQPPPPPPPPAEFGLSKNDQPYMVRVQENTAGVLHDHLALFKVRLWE